MRFRLKTIYLLVSALLLMAVTMFIVFMFAVQVTKYEEDLADLTIKNIAKSNAEAVYNTFASYTNLLNAIAIMLQESNEEYNSPKTLKILNKIAQKEGFLRLAIDYPNATSYTSDDKVIDFSGRRGVEHIIESRVYINDVMDSSQDALDVLIGDVPIINISVPLLNKSGKATTALRGVISTKILSISLDLNLYEGQSYYFIIDGNGRYVAYDQRINEDFFQKNYFTEIEKLSFVENFSAEAIFNAFKNRESTYSVFFDKDSKVHAQYTPIGINNWFIVIVVPVEYINEQVKNNIRYAISMLAAIIILLLLVFAYIHISQRSLRIKAELNDKCFRTLSEQSGKVIFEWDFEADKIVSLTNFKLLFGHSAVTKSSSQESLHAKVVHEEDQETFLEVFNKIKSGQGITNYKFRVKNAEEEFIWCSLTGIIVNDHKGKPFKAIGSLENIHEQILKEERLYIEAQIDGLTKFYNKKASEFLIEDVFATSSKEEVHALVCLDLDNFKTINDSFGHLFGDEVLIEVAKKIKNIFRVSDILGRFGGDEFVLLIKKLPHIEFIKEKVEYLRLLIRKKYTVNDVSHVLSVSIGVSIFAGDGETYEELYRKADIASYQAKKLGKNQCVFYSESGTNTETTGSFQFEKKLKLRDIQEPRETHESGETHEPGEKFCIRGKE